MGAGIEPEKDARQAGFSLLELMVVTAVLATLSVGAVLAPNVRRGPDDLARFQATFDTQQALAIVGRDRRGLQIDTKGIHLMLWRNGEWIASGSKRRWQGRPVFSSPEFRPIGDPDLIFEADGETQVFSITFKDGARCVGDGWTGVSCSAS